MAEVCFDLRNQSKQSTDYWLVNKWNNFVTFLGEFVIIVWKARSSNSMIPLLSRQFYKDELYYSMAILGASRSVSSEAF
jgi:hypothetical protein